MIRVIVARARAIVQIRHHRRADRLFDASMNRPGGGFFYYGLKRQPTASRWGANMTRYVPTVFAEWQARKGNAP
jgi:hypothetical protein